MKPLDLYFQQPAGDIKDKVSKLASSLQVKDFDREKWRGRVEEDFGIRLLKSVPIGDTGFVAVDSSITAQNVRYHALWGLHCVSLYGLYNGKCNEDPVVGHGSVPYSDLLYDSTVDLGSFRPYWMIEQQLNHIRVAREYSAAVKAFEELSSAGRRVDFVLVDGSLKTNNTNLAVKSGLETAGEALDAQKKLLALGRVVSLCEDSHSSDVSRKWGLNMSNLMFFDLVLREGEYVVDSGRFNVCYVKLPGKSLSYSDSESSPVTVRWEFSYPDFGRDLDLISAIWLAEDDILHPQLYPVRMADYLTRRIKTSGILGQVLEEMDSDLEFRELREF